MYSGKLVFAQVMEQLPKSRFHHLVDQYGGHRKVKSFSCGDPYRCMAFAQLTYRSSLRDIEACLHAQSSKLYHMGIRGGVARNTLANANNVRDWRLHASFAQHLITQARGLYDKDSHGLDIDSTVYALDSSTIDLCLSLFPWARFRKTKAAVKLDTLHLHGAHFVLRAKKNAPLRRLYSREVDRTTEVLCDQVVLPDPKKISRQAAPHPVRRPGKRQVPGVSDQRLRPAAPDHR